MTRCIKMRYRPPMPRKLFVVEGPKHFALKAFHVCTHNGRTIAVFPAPIEYSEEMGLAEAREHAIMLVKAACLHEAARLALGALAYGNCSKQSVDQAIRFLQGALNEAV